MKQDPLKQLFDIQKNKTFSELFKKYNKLLSIVLPENLNFAIQEYKNQHSREISLQRLADPNSFIEKFYTHFFVKQTKLGYSFSKALLLAKEESRITYKEIFYNNNGTGFFPYVEEFINQSDEIIVKKIAQYSAETEFLIDFEKLFKSDKLNNIPNIIGIHLSEKQKVNYEDKIYLTIDDLSDYCNISKSTIYSYTSKKEIPHIKRGKKLLFLKADIDKWLIEARKQTKEEYCKNRI